MSGGNPAPGIETFKNSDERYDVHVDGELWSCGYPTEAEAFRFAQEVADKLERN